MELISPLGHCVRVSCQEEAQAGSARLHLHAGVQDQVDREPPVRSFCRKATAHFRKAVWDVRQRPKLP